MQHVYLKKDSRKIHWNIYKWKEQKFTCKKDTIVRNFGELMNSYRKDEMWLEIMI